MYTANRHTHTVVVCVMCNVFGFQALNNGTSVWRSCQRSMTRGRPNERQMDKKEAGTHTAQPNGNGHVDNRIPTDIFYFIQRIYIYEWIIYSSSLSYYESRKRLF